MRDASHTADSYLAFWNETDAAARRRLMADCLAEDATYVDPMGRGEGIQGIDALVGAVQGAFPGHRFSRLGKVDAYGSHLRFTWELKAADGALMARGTDYAEMDGAGRLKAVTGFIDHLAAQQ